MAWNSYACENLQTMGGHIWPLHMLHMGSHIWLFCLQSHLFSIHKYHSASMAFMAPSHWLEKTWSAVHLTKQWQTTTLHGNTNGKPWWLENMGSHKATRQQLKTNTGSMIPERMGSHDGFKNMGSHDGCRSKDTVKIWKIHEKPCMAHWTDKNAAFSPFSCL